MWFFLSAQTIQTFWQRLGRTSGCSVLGLLMTLANPSLAAGQTSSQWQEEVVSIMTQETLAEIYRYPYSVGEKDSELAVWPLLLEDVTGINQVGYLYESIEFSSIPGFMGVPYNLLVAIDNSGAFIDVRVLYHREPMFMGGVGEIPMRAFAEQYPGLLLTNNIKFRENHNQRSDDLGNTYIDGISGATASVRVLNQTLLSSALKIARAKLGFGAGKSPDEIARIDRSLYEHGSWSELVDNGLIHHASQSDLVNLYVTDLMIPSVGKSLLPEPLWQQLNEELSEGDHALLVVSTGRYSFKHEGTQRGGISDRLQLRQEGLPIELRDLDFEDRIDDSDPDFQLRLPPDLASGLSSGLAADQALSNNTQLSPQTDWMVYRVLAAAGLDVALPLAFTLPIQQQEPSTYSQPEPQSFEFEYQVPDDYYYVPQSHDSGWQSVWLERSWEIALVLVAVLLLFACLFNLERLTQEWKHFQWFRTGFLLFTLGFIGWYAQGQLSIVNLTGSIQALMAGANLGFMLYDPISTLLWSCVLVTFFLWGRGAFCGWLCPFGALQELATKAFDRFGFRQYQPSSLWDRRLKRIKYLVLFSLIVSAFVAPNLSNQLVEFEPFKTGITFYFVREWPFVLWAVALVALSLVVYKGYCRYLCPLGAAMAVLGKVRLLNWLPRRSECGSPCQFCHHACEYDAIEKDGSIDYDECFQCLDCVVIYHHDTLCVPKIVERKQGRKRSGQPNQHQLIATDVGSQTI